MFHHGIKIARKHIKNHSKIDKKDTFLVKKGQKTD